MLNIVSFKKGSSKRRNSFQASCPTKGCDLGKFPAKREKMVLGAVKVIGVFIYSHKHTR